MSNYTLLLPWSDNAIFEPIAPQYSSFLAEIGSMSREENAWFFRYLNGPSHGRLIRHLSTTVSLSSEDLLILRLKYPDLIVHEHAN